MHVSKSITCNELYNKKFSINLSSGLLQGKIGVLETADKFLVYHEDIKPHYMVQFNIVQFTLDFIQTYNPFDTKELIEDFEIIAHILISNRDISGVIIYINDDDDPCTTIYKQNMISYHDILSILFDQIFSIPLWTIKYLIICNSPVWDQEIFTSRK